MQEQVTVRLPEDLSRALKATARRMQRNRSEIVRMALRQYLGTRPGQGPRPGDRVSSLIGSLESGLPDLPEKTPPLRSRVTPPWPVSCSATSAGSRSFRASRGRVPRA